MRMTILLSKAFQSTLPCGSDRKHPGYRVVSVEFQSTLPRGSDIKGMNKLLALLNFNPRSLAGATIDNDLSADEIGISIHAPSRERLK